MTANRMSVEFHCDFGGSTDARSEQIAFRTPAWVDLDEDGGVVSVDLLAVPDAVAAYAHHRSGRGGGGTIATGAATLDADGGWLVIPFDGAGRTRSRVRGDAEVLVTHDDRRLVEVTVRMDHRSPAAAGR